MNPDTRPAILIKKPSYLSLFITIALTLTLLAGCIAPTVTPATDAATEVPTEATVEATAEPTEESAEESAEEVEEAATEEVAEETETAATAPIEVEDANGNMVVIEDASRIIAVGGPVTEIIFALGAGDQVIARDSSSSYPPEVNDLPDVGYQRQLAAEGVLALEPSLILASTEAGPPETLEQLADSGVTFLLLPAVDTVDGVKVKIRGFAQALGKEAEGEELIAKIDADLAEAAEIAAQNTEHTRVLFIYARGAGAVSVAGMNTGAQAMIELAGGENAITEVEGYTPLTAEAVVAAEPDVILMFTDGLESLGGEAGLLEIPGIADTPAAENGRIITMDGLFLLNFGPRIGEAAKELATLLQGE